jgi:hypothetical protein
MHSCYNKYYHTETIVSIDLQTNDDNNDGRIKNAKKKIRLDYYDAYLFTISSHRMV